MRVFRLPYNDEFTVLRRYCLDVFYNSDHRHFTPVNNALSYLTLISTLSIVLESVVLFHPYAIIFHGIEIVSVFFFTLEYTARLIAHRQPLRYIFSFWGVIDLLAILPSYLALGNLTALKSARLIRILRALRLLRMAKMARIEHKERIDPEDYEAIVLLTAKIYIMAIVAVITILGSLLYIFEFTHEPFANIPKSMLWVLNSFLEGDVAKGIPETTAGMVVGIVARVFALIFLGCLIHLVGTATNALLLGVKRKRTRKHLEEIAESAGE